MKKIEKNFSTPPCCRKFHAAAKKSEVDAFYAVFRNTDGIVAGINLLAALPGANKPLPCSFSCASFSTGRAQAHAPVLYLDENNYYALGGRREDDGTISFRGILTSPNPRADPKLLEALNRGDRLLLSATELAVLKGAKALWRRDLRSSVRRPILLAPGERLLHKQIRTSLIETAFLGGGDIFGNTRLSLLAGDLQANGHPARVYTLESGPSGPTGRAHEKLINDPFMAGSDLLVFYRSAPANLVTALQAANPRARLYLYESGRPFDLPQGVEVGLSGRLPLLRRVEMLSGGLKTTAALEPGLYVPPDDLFSPDLKRVTIGPKISRGDAAIPELLGRLNCPYRKPAGQNPLYDGLDLKNKVAFTGGCTMCLFRTEGAGGADQKSWVDSMVRQMRWMLERNPAFRRFRLADHASLDFLGALLRRLRAENLGGLTLMLDARVDQLLSPQAKWPEIIRLARPAQTRLDFTCVGFENFSQPELDRLNKGTSVRQNVAAVALMRRLRDRAPDVFSLESAAAGFILFTPWTTPEDLKTNLRALRALNFSEFRNGVLKCHLRLFAEMPLYHLAAKDGLLLKHVPAGWRQRAGYGADHPWKFRHHETEAIFNAVNRRLGGGWRRGGEDVEILETALRQTAQA